LILCDSSLCGTSRTLLAKDRLMYCARIVWLLALMAASGCAPVARLQVFRPAAHDLVGVERIAILEFDAPDASAREVRRAMAESFAENRSYTLVEPAVLETVHAIKSPNGRTDRAAALDAAQQVGVDALLAGESAAAGSLRTELIDVRSGEVLAAPTVVKAPAELVARLAPHYEPVEVTLARQWWGEGKANVSAGNALARQGDWAAAAEKWEEAKNANPANHAALHNLALAAEARQDYRTAFKLLDQALEQFPLKLYHQTRKAMESRQTTFLAAARQVDAIRAAALAHAAPPDAATIAPAGHQSPFPQPDGERHSQ
jgi:tetratricopeptide (TPR) repeat protein